MTTQQPTMPPDQFIAKWRRSRGQETAGAQEWFLDLCRVVEHPTPAEMDRSQQWYTFERSVREASGRLGRADVYKQGYFAWEFKGLHRDLDEAYRQLLRYREALNNPPLLVVSDFQTIRVRTNFTNKVPVVHTILLDDLGEPESLAILRSVFHDPNALEPEITPDKIGNYIPVYTAAGGMPGGSLSRGVSRGYGKAAIAGAKCTDEFRSCTATGM